MPTRSSFGVTSFPVSERPELFHPTLSHGPMPIVNTIGSPVTRHSIATTSSSWSAGRSLLCPTHSLPSCDAGGEATSAGHPAANVVGLPLAAAKQELRAGGPVRIRVDKVPFGQSGIVQRMLGFEFDGTINSGSTIVLQVGTKRLKPWSITHLR